MQALSHFFMLLVCVGEGSGYSLSSIFAAKLRPVLGIGAEKPPQSPSLTSPLASLLSHDSHHTTENAYLHAITVLDDLRSKPSCHRESIGSLLTSCFELQKAPNSNAIDNKKAILASRIAICEFESAGVEYPLECRSLRGEEGDFSREEVCMKKLANKPQWWTTLSNSMQTVNVVCRSVGREVERDELLELHTNITVAERELYLAVQKALAEVFTAAEYQGTFSKNMNEAFATILKEMDRIRIRMRQSYRASEDEIVGTLTDIRDEAEVTRKETASTFNWLRQEIQHAHQFMAIWDVSFRRFWSQVEKTGENAHASTKDLVDTVESLTSSLKHSSNDVAKIFQDVMTLAEALNGQAISTKAVLDSQAEQSREMLQFLETKLAETQQSLDSMQNSISFSAITLEWTVQYLFWFLNQILVRVVICTVLSILAGMISKGGLRRMAEIGGLLMCTSFLISLPQSLSRDLITTQYTLLSGAFGAIVVSAFYIREHLRVKRLEEELEREYRGSMRIYRESRQNKPVGGKWSFKRRGARSLLGNSGTW